MLIKIRLHYAATIESLTESWHQPPKSRDNIINKQIIDNIQWIFNTQNKDMSKISTPGERPSYISYIAPTILDRTEQNVRAMPSHQFHMLGNLRLTIKEADYNALNSNTV